MPKVMIQRWRNVSVLPLLVGLFMLLLSHTGQAQLSGSYSIGSTGTYSNFSAAVSALTTSGVSGPVSFTVQAGTYTEKITIPAISGASATNTITFDGGTGNAATRVLTYNATSSYTNVITLNGADYVRFRNITIQSTGSSYGTGILFTNSADYNEITDCIISLPTTATSSQQVGIRASSTTGTGSSGDHGSFNLIQGNSFIGGYAGVYWYGSGSSDYTTVQGNKFIDNTLTEWYYYGMRIYYAGGSLVVKNNTAIQRPSGTTSSGYGFYIYYPNNGPEISYNYVHARYGGVYAYRMNYYPSSPVRGRYYNNMMTVDGTSTMYGIYCSYARHSDIAYNSARLISGGNGTGSGTGYGIYHYGESTNYSCNVVNNITSYEGTGTFRPFYNYYYESFNTVDYNLSYRVGSGTTEWRWDGTYYTTLSALKSAVPAQHQSSLEGDPGFFSNVDLHSTSLNAYQKAVPVVGITDDFDGDTRSTTVPCIGADEFTVSTMAYSSSTVTQASTAFAPAGFTDQEIIAIEVDVTGSLSPINATSFCLTTTGTTATADLAGAKIYYTGRTNSYSTSNLFGSVVSPSGTFTINGSQALEGPGTNYFWLAYDIAASAPTGNYVDAQCTSVTVASTAYAPTVTNPTGSRMIIAPMNGIYTINPTGTGSRNYTSFTAAIADLAVYGVGGPVTFEVAAATYNEQPTFIEVAGADATNTITFDGGVGNASTRIIQYNAPQYQAVMTLDGADYFRFRNLTVNSLGTSYGYGFLFTGQADYNEITDCVISLSPSTTNSYNIGICASSTGSYSSYGNHGNYNLIKDNTINSGYYGIRWNGSSSSSTTQSVGNQFIGNTVQDFYYYGMYLYYSAQIKVQDNYVRQRSSGTVTTSSGYGIYVYYPNDGPVVTGNYTEAHYNPMRVYRINNSYTSSANRGLVANNRLVGIGTSTMYGLYVSYAAYADIVYNSVNLFNNTSTCYGLYEYGQSSAYNVKVTNNYIAYDGNGTFYPVYNYYYESQTQFDYNAFWHVGSGSEQWRWDGTTYTSLSSLKSSVPAYHQNTVEGNPYFVAQNDLHSRSHVGYQAGTPVTVVTDDMDGDPRSTTMPCIGADEYPAPPPEYDVAVAKVRWDYATDRWAHREGTSSHEVRVLIESVGILQDIPQVTLVYKVGSAPADIADGVAQTFSPSWANGQAVMTFSQPITGLAAMPSEAVYVRAFHPQDPNVANDVSYDMHEVFIEKVHGFENFDAFQTPFFSYADGLLDLPWKITDNNGGDQVETGLGLGTGGSASIMMNGTVNPADEWIFTPAALLEEAASYRLAFMFNNLGSTPVTMEIAYGPSQDATSMTTFGTFSNIGTGLFTAKDLWVNSGEFGDPYFNTAQGAGGMYYIGIHIITNGTGYTWSIDDIKLDDNPSPPPKIGYALPGTPIAGFINDNSVPIKISVNYKQPGTVNKTFQVATTTNIYGQNGDFLWDVESTTSWIRLTKQTPDPTLQGYNFTPPRPRQFQTFTLSVNPAGLAPGVHMGSVTFYGMLFNDDFLPPNSGLAATNEPFTVPVELHIIDGSGKTGQKSMTATISTPMTPAGSPYPFVDPVTRETIATVTVTGGQIDKMTITTFPNQLPQNIARMLYVMRYWQIQHTGTGWTADIDFPYADQEAAMIADRMQLRGVRQAVPLGAWEDPIFGTTSVSDPLNSSVLVRDFDEFNIGGNIALAHPYAVFGRDNNTAAPTAFALEQNYPNPFNPSTSIAFSVPEETHVRVAIYNGLGMEVAVLVDETMPAGSFETTFDATGLASGTYLCRMTANGFVQTRTMTLSK